jgi:hypothetical protein
VPEKKSLFGRDPNLLFAGRLCLRSQPTMLEKPTGMMQGIFQTERLVNGARQGQHLIVDLPCLVRKT